jgi:hypothetical protein
MGAVCSRGIAVADIGPPKVDLQKTGYLGEQAMQSVQTEQAGHAEQTGQAEQAEQAEQTEQGIVVAIVVEEKSEQREAEPVRIELTLQRVEEETTSEPNETNETNAIEQYKESIGQIERR